MNQALTTAIAAMRNAVDHERPTMFWGEAMKHVEVLLQHVHLPSVAEEHLAAAQMAIAENRLQSAAQHLQKALISLGVRSGERVVQMADLLDAFDQALSVRPFLWLEIGYNRVTDWMVTIYDKAGGTERVLVQVGGFGPEETSQRAARQLQALIKEEHHD